MEGNPWDRNRLPDKWHCPWNVWISDSKSREFWLDTDEFQCCWGNDDAAPHGTSECPTPKLLSSVQRDGRRLFRLLGSMSQSESRWDSRQQDFCRILSWFSARN